MRRRQWRGYREGKPFARADLRILDGRADFDLGWPTQTISFKNSSRAAIAMMQTADLRNRDHLSFRWMLDSTWHRCITFQRKVSA